MGEIFIVDEKDNAQSIDILACRRFRKWSKYETFI